MLRECGDPHDDLFLEATVDGGAACLVTADADLPEIGSISDALISDATWVTLAERYDMRQLMAAVFTVGQHTMAAMYLSSLGVQFDEGFEGLPVQ